MMYNQETYRFRPRYELVETDNSGSPRRHRWLRFLRTNRRFFAVGVAGLFSLVLALEDLNILGGLRKEETIYELSFRQSHGYVVETKAEWLARQSRWQDMHNTNVGESQQNNVARPPYSELRLPTSAKNLPNWYEESILIDFDCPNSRHILGSASSSDPKWRVCNPEMLAQIPDCIIYYSGPPNGLLWERNFLRAFPSSTCQIHVLDPTELSIAPPTETTDGDISSSVIVQPWGLGARTSDNVEVGESIVSLKTLEDTMKELDHDHVDLLLLNCAGCEWAVYDQIASANGNAGAPVVDQFLVQANGMKDKGFFQS
eukprot:CAMPEP_0194043556 /NCGR_PEP_ID=MMETSP0009_2-20130614/15158_1 /TAXON_ID=210454 /ORGANISM="Grammatophora oceanica, Strain CCMP 410" /LENGTH=314 /DNA_ID=CAMNT_0038687799 /DNA_START=41 /DNA_END=981 /DNA_ORIENTATION=+